MAAETAANAATAQLPIVELVERFARALVRFRARDGKVLRVTYRELYDRVCEFANGLKALGRCLLRPSWADQGPPLQVLDV